MSLSVFYLVGERDLDVHYYGSKLNFISENDKDLEILSSIDFNESFVVKLSHHRL